jgi:hypothetical protein
MTCSTISSNGQRSSSGTVKASNAIAAGHNLNFHNSKS